MNYKAIGMSTLEEYANKTDYSLGEILYSILRTPVSGITSIKEIKDISDEDMYTIIEKAMNAEEDIPFKNPSE
jgi:hypothetical protein